MLEVWKLALCWRGRAALSGAGVVLASSCALPDLHRLPDETGGTLATGGHTGITGGVTGATTAGPSAGNTGTGGALNSGGTFSTAAATQRGGTASSTGGTPWTEGGAISGGASASGGTQSNSVTTNAGATATGGAATGGDATMGGIASTGGALTTGGIPATGSTFVPVTASTKSCSNLGFICQDESCCMSIQMPGGTYLMGRATEDCGSAGCRSGADNEGCPVRSTCYPEEQPEHSATVSAFALDKYEVTVGRFRNFVGNYNTWHGENPKSGDGVNPNASSTGWGQSWSDAAEDLPTDATALVSSLKCDSSYQTWTDSADPSSEAEAYPINCVTWYQAFAFCIWDGGWLPTEAEWEYAATGGAQNRLYPWGSAGPDATRANFGSSDVVGSKMLSGGAGYFGHADLAGSMWEWAFDWYNSAYYGTAEAPSSCNNCTNSASGSNRVLRGGGWFDFASDLRAAYRDSSAPANRYYGVGFRCARTP